MRYAKLTFKYLNNHKLTTLLYAIVPGFLISFAVNPSNLFLFFVNFFEGELYNLSFSEIVGETTQILRLGGWSIPLSLGACVVIAVFTAALSGLTEREMRLGDMKPRFFWRFVNGNLMPAVKFVLFYYLIFQIYGFLSASFFYLWVNVISNAAAAFAMCLVTVLLLTVFMVILFIYFALWLPHMASSGLKGRTALAEAAKNMMGNFFRLLAAALLVLLPALLIFAGISAADNYIGGVTGGDGVLANVFRFGIYPFAYAFLFAYIIVLGFSAYFDIFRIDREDLNKKSVWNGGGQ